MSAALQHRLLSVTTPLGPDAFLLTGFSGREGLSRLFRFELELLSEQDAAVGALVGGPISWAVHSPGRPPRFFHGVVRRFTSAGREVGAFRTYRAVVVPWVWALTRGAECRAFRRPNAAGDHRSGVPRSRILGLRICAEPHLLSARALHPVPGSAVSLHLPPAAREGRLLFLPPRRGGPPARCRRRSRGVPGLRGESAALRAGRRRPRPDRCVGASLRGQSGRVDSDRRGLRAGFHRRRTARPGVDS